MRVLLFGATGHLGTAIAKELAGRGIDFTIVARSREKAEMQAGLTDKYLLADALNPVTLQQLNKGYDVIVSSMGKSVSPNDKGKSSFMEVDYQGNSNILEYALKNNVKKFVYISAFHSEKYLQLDYFRAHHNFAEKLKKSGLDYAVIKPVAIFSAFIDVVEMARKGMLVNIGAGQHKTNPIYEGDLARIVADALNQPNAEIEAGGKHIYTRRQLNEIINTAVNGPSKLRTVPVWLFKLFLPLMRIADKNMYDKFAFFIEVLSHDTIAPALGEMTFESYINSKT